MDALSSLLTRRQAFTAVLSSVLAAGIVGSAAANMKAYRWKKRPLLVFAPDRTHPAFKRQQKLLGGRGARLRDRDMVVIFVVGNSVSSRYGAGPGASASQLRQRYGVSRNAFGVVLVGKDAGVKRRSGAPVTAESLFSQIDTMPMRRQEMKRKRKAS